MKRRLTTEKLMREHTERINIGAMIDVLAAALFRRHVRGRSDRRSRARQGCLTSRPIEELCDTEVDHLREQRATSIEDDEDVVRLQIAVRNASGMCCIERARDWPENGNGISHW